MHIPFVVNRTFNATPTGSLQQHPFLFTTNHTNRTFFLWSVHLARPSHPGHSTILLQSESPSSKCAKLCTVAASNNRDHSFIACSCCIYMGVILCGHPIRGESHVQRNANWEVATPWWKHSSVKCHLKLLRPIKNAAKISLRSSLIVCTSTSNQIWFLLLKD